MTDADGEVSAIPMGDKLTSVDTDEAPSLASAIGAESNII